MRESEGEVTLTEPERKRMTEASMGGSLSWLERSDGHRTGQRFDMKKMGVYILRCANGRFYVGSTDDVERRLREHAAGNVKATRHIRPIELAYFHPCDILTRARQLERGLKAKKSRKIIERIVVEQRMAWAASSVG